MRRLALASLLAATPAAAHGYLDFRPQATLALNVSLPESRAFGGLELNASGTLFGLGVCAAFGWERAALTDGADGGYFMSQFQFRPLTWTDDGRPFSDVDLRLGIGAMLGGLHPTTFRAGVVTALGADIELVPLDDAAPLLSVELRVVSPATPDGSTEFFFLVGLGARVAD